MSHEIIARGFERIRNDRGDVRVLPALLARPLRARMTWAKRQGRDPLIIWDEYFARDDDRDFLRDAGVRW